MLDAVRDIRIEDPGIGCYKLWTMLPCLLEQGSCLGGTAFMHCSANTAWMLPDPQDPAYDALQPSLPQVEEPNQGLTDFKANQLWVSDITYIPHANGEVCYLHLISVLPIDSGMVLPTPYGSRQPSSIATGYRAGC